MLLPPFITPFLLPILTLATTVILGLLLVRMAVPFGFIDLPGDRKPSRQYNLVMAMEHRHKGP